MAADIPSTGNLRRNRHGRRRPRFDRLLAFCQSVPILLSVSCGSYFFAATTSSFSLQHPHSLSPPRISHPTQTSSLSMVQTMGSRGLSRYFQAILSRNRDRQRFVTGKYPVIVSVQENPTQKWLNKDSATSLLLVNDTTLDRSLASYDRFQWLDAVEQQELHDRYASISLELLAEVHMPKPGYVQILSSLGAGSSAEAVREHGSTTRWNRWQNSTLYQELFLDELLQRRKQQTPSLAVLPTQDRLWVTGFSLAGRKGFVKSMDVDTGHIESVNARSEAMTLWPNELSNVPKNLIGANSPGTYVLEDDALLVSDGFLVPGKDRGGIYVIQNPGNPHSEWTVSLTDREGERWFYHRAVWVDLTGDGRKSILTARAKLRKVAGSRTTDGNPFGFRFNAGGANDEDLRPKNGQLVWLEMPEPHHFDEATGTPLEEDGTEFDPFSLRHLPWREHVLARGPDVMFNIADMDTTDDTIEVISSQFFDKKVTLHSIKRGPKPRITFARVIDDRCGAAFGGILADLLGKRVDDSSINTDSVIIDTGSTVDSLKAGDSFSHVLVTSHECNYAENGSQRTSMMDIHADQTVHHNTHSPDHHISKSESMDGGSLFTYKVPEGKDAWKTEPWVRTTVASGFKVKGQLWNVINPGAPGFVYTFHAKLDDRQTGKRPLIVVAGDCAESAYIFRPEKVDLGSEAEGVDPEASYKLMCEIKCGATVGSIGVGYENLCSVEQESGYAKLYIPCYEKDKILVFALGSGEGEDGEDSESGYEARWHHAKSLLI
mmetsp:Transcript_110113/g.307858  ORF Transcript_110113/g.307858 Transcript_110113/m.307858 type:complete len:773 (-) Transcript_110113:37-2355(-)